MQLHQSLFYQFVSLPLILDITTTPISSTPGNDYTPLTSITFVDGADEACELVEIRSDNTLESNEDFTLSINPGQPDIVVDHRDTATVTIIEDRSK